MLDREKYEYLKKIPGVVWKKSENYQVAYKLEPFGIPAEWLEIIERDERAAEQ